MLQHLTISHYALIESLDIDFRTGFTVITGETGAGKSIMLGALNLLLGGRADAKAIQVGEKKCMVEASFNIEGLNLKPFFEQNDIDYDATDCIVRREVMQSGKSRAFINDTPVAAAKLKELGASLIDIHSQHQNLLIRNEHFLIQTLDVIAAQPSLLESYKQTYSACKEAEHLLHQLQERGAKGKDDQEYLQFQLSALDNAQLQAEEQTQLEAEQQVLSHAEDIKQSLYQAQQLMTNDEVCLSQNLRRVVDNLNSISDNLPEAGSLAERLSSLRIELDDVESELQSHIDHIEYDPARLAFIEERLNLIYSLEQKHHVNSVEELLELSEKLRNELDAIENVDADIERQSKEVERLQAMRNKEAAVLTASRKKAALAMQSELIEALQQLGMPNTQLKVEIEPRTEPDATGADKVTFLFSANKNVPMQDVSAIASGGEIARLMLALKALIARRTSLPTLVFDEIDTGVSGTMAERMAQTMLNISASCQVLCITHLPQIAALGNHHFKVYKDDEEGTTRSHIIQLTTEQRIEEVAHMLSGTELTEAAINNAKALLKV